jgi:hypothetical protein
MTISRRLDLNTSKRINIAMEPKTSKVQEFEKTSNS